MGGAARRLVACCVALAVASSVASARADGEASLAESLFQQGLAAMERGEIERACSFFEDSQRLDPGGGTLLNLALCQERAGRLATAWARYLEALAAARRDGRDDRVAFAEQRLHELEPNLPRMAISLREPAPGARVTLDGVDLPASAWAAPSPVDPGEHDLRVEAPGRRPHVSRVVIGVGETRTVVIPALAPSWEPPPEPRPSGATQRVLGWSLAGVGGAGVIVTGVLGALAIGAESTADAACPGTGPCNDPRGLDASERASSFATAATITGIAALALAAGGVVLLLTAPSASP